MPNYGNLTPEQVAWLAGLLQAEANYSMDSRVRSKGNDASYEAPPPYPLIKLEMIEKDVMETVGKYVGEKVNLQKRVTSAGNPVYRVSVASRSKVETLLRAILPYTVGEVRRTQLEKLIALCDQYTEWVAKGGHRLQASAAARAGHAKRREQKLRQLQQDLKQEQLDKNQE